MGVFLDEKVISGINITNTLIRRELSQYENESIFTDSVKLTPEVFLNTSLITAWNNFYHILNNNPKKLDENTGFNQENIAEYITFSVERYTADKVEFLSDLLRVLAEFHFWTGLLRNSNIISHYVLTLLSDRFDNNNGRNSQFRYIRDELSLSLTKWLLNSPGFTAAKHIIHNINSEKDNFIEEVTARKTEYLLEIDKREHEIKKSIEDEYATINHKIKSGKEEVIKKVDSIAHTLSEVEALEKRVDDLKSEYNFVGLSSGFNKIKEKKDKELKLIEGNYTNLFGCIFIVPVALFILHLFAPSLFPKDYTVLFLALPFFTIEMALIYFFRLSYLEAKSIRTQLVQIELRLSLCSFIDGYVDYRKKNNANIDKVLDSFDSLIFSPIQTNENNIPSMFDGVEALAGLAEKITKK